MSIQVFAPVSPEASAIQRLFEITLYVCAAILAIVTVALVTIMIRYRQRGPGDPPQTGGSRRLEIVWTAIPILIVSTLFVLTVRTARAVDHRVTRGPDVIVTGHQWWWHVEYPAANAITANEIHIPYGRDFLVQVDAADVIHDFWAPQLSRKIDAIPGKHNFVWVRADKAGEYRGFCAEYCGAEHAWMQFRVVAESPEAYENWLAQQASMAVQPSGDDAARGAKLFTARTCSNCHTIRGVNPVNPYAPDLTHLGSRKMLAAERLLNTPENLARWLARPEEFKPGSYMPNLKLGDADVRALTAYLEGLK